MATISLQMDNHEQSMTVREMRQRLARMLSKLDGDLPVSFSFHARVESYTPRTVSTPRSIIYGEFARPEND